MLAICQPNVSVLLLADAGLQDNSLAQVIAPYLRCPSFIIHE